MASLGGGLRAFFRSRRHCQTTVTGLSVADARELVSSAGPYIDLVKLGWGTARLMPRARVAEKVRVYLEAEIEVCPGGTFLEVAAAHGLEGRFFEEALALGFSCIEVSDGVLEMGRHKLELISQAKQQGFRVVSEVGTGAVALLTGEQKILPKKPRYWICLLYTSPSPRD